MNTPTAKRFYTLTTLFMREQIREPISLIWTLISPSAIFYLLSQSNTPSTTDRAYIESTAWFYAYIACSVAFFGVAYYIIGRRESGFIRSFIYAPSAKVIFLAAHIACYSAISTLYCLAFYLITKPYFGDYDLIEATSITLKFLICFIGFCSPALILGNSKLRFQTANTLISILMFGMILLALFASKNQDTTSTIANLGNIFLVAKKFISGDSPTIYATVAVATLLTLSFILTAQKLRINPVWSRY